MKCSLVEILAVFCLIAVLAGCGGKFTRGHFESVYVGQEAWEVAQTLGEPTTRFAGQWHYIQQQQEGYCKAVIIFDQNNRVAEKRWHDVQGQP